MDGRDLGLAIVAVGVGVVVIGLLVATGAFAWFRRLPGDLRLGGGHVRVYAPIVSMLVISVVLTIVLNVLGRLR